MFMRGKVSVRLLNARILDQILQAVSNEQSVIVSDIRIGGTDYGLTDLGQQQAAQVRWL